VRYRVFISGSGPKPDVTQFLISLGLAGHLVRRVRPTAEERFDTFVDKSGPLFNGTPCWRWTGALRDGYGLFLNTNRSESAHRWNYERLVGPIREGLQLDHLCRVRRCVNPEHLEPVTQRENVLRGIGASALNARKTHCIMGHLLLGENLDRYASAGHRKCRTCWREYHNQYMREWNKTHGRKNQ